MTIIKTHDCHLAKEYIETQFILFEGYRCRITALKSSAVEQVAATISIWL